MGDAFCFIRRCRAQYLLVDLHADQSHWNAYLGTAWQYPKKENKKEMGNPHGGSASGLHIVQPVGSNLFVVDAGLLGCIQLVAIGDEVVTIMVQADDVHGTNNFDLVVSTITGNIVTLESMFGILVKLEVAASQGLFVSDVSRRLRDAFGVYVPVMLEIFDNRPNIANKPDKGVYKVEIQDGISSTRVICVILSEDYQ